MGGGGAGDAEKGFTLPNEALERPGPEKGAPITVKLDGGAGDAKDSSTPSHEALEWPGQEKLPPNFREAGWGVALLKMATGSGGHGGRKRGEVLLRWLAETPQFS